MADEIDEPQARLATLAPKDVLRGVLEAYLWCVAALAVVAVPTLLFPQAGLGAAAFVAVAALVGLFLMLPAGLAALAVYYSLRAVRSHVAWWSAPLAATALLALLFVALAQAPAGAIWGLILGPFTGYAFWRGAVGRASSAILQTGASA